MAIGRILCAVLLACACGAPLRAQDAGANSPVANPPAATATPDSDPALKHRPEASAEPPAAKIIPLAVPAGTPLRVVVDHETRIEKVGQPIHGRTTEPVYAFDKLVVPEGSEVDGQISKIEEISSGKRTAAVLDADFTPPHKIEVEFSELVLPDGKHIPIHTVVTPGSGEVMQLVTAADEKESKKGQPSPVAQKTKEAKQDAKRDWEAAMKMVNEPGKMHKIERYAVAQLPIHPQYIDAGTVYFAELLEPLDFGSEPLTPEIAAALSSPPPDGSTVHARLLTPLSSATTKKGEDVEAMVTEPLFDAGRLIIPQGSLLKGSIVQVEPARSLSRSGQLRFVFHNLVLPMGLDQRVDAFLAGVQSD